MLSDVRPIDLGFPFFILFILGECSLDNSLSFFTIFVFGFFKALLSFFDSFWSVSIDSWMQFYKIIYLLHFQIEIFSSFLRWIAGLPIFFCDLPCNPTIFDFYTPLTIWLGVVRSTGKNSNSPFWYSLFVMVMISVI
jgi:hypothetical protein